MKYIKVKWNGPLPEKGEIPVSMGGFEGPAEKDLLDRRPIVRKGEIHGGWRMLRDHTGILSIPDTDRNRKNLLGHTKCKNYEGGPLITLLDEVDLTAKVESDDAVTMRKLQEEIAALKKAQKETVRVEPVKAVEPVAPVAPVAPVEAVAPVASEEGVTAPRRGRPPKSFEP